MRTVAAWMWCRRCRRRCRRRRRRVSGRCCGWRHSRRHSWRNCWDVRRCRGWRDSDENARVRRRRFLPIALLAATLVAAIAPLEANPARGLIAAVAAIHARVRSGSRCWIHRRRRRWGARWCHRGASRRTRGWSHRGRGRGARLRVADTIRCGWAGCATKGSALMHDDGARLLTAAAACRARRPCVDRGDAVDGAGMAVAVVLLLQTRALLAAVFCGGDYTARARLHAAATPLRARVPAAEGGKRAIDRCRRRSRCGRCGRRSCRCVCGCASWYQCWRLRRSRCWRRGGRRGDERARVRASRTFPIALLATTCVAAVAASFVANSAAGLVAAMAVINAWVWRWSRRGRGRWARCGRHGGARSRRRGW